MNYCLILRRRVVLTRFSSATIAATMKNTLLIVTYRATSDYQFYTQE
jgi:hypothetical protein